MEEWKLILSFPDYYVSSYGRIKNKHGKILKYLIDNDYPEVRLYLNQKSHRRTIHRLVALAFIPNSENKATVNHRDGNKENNYVTNLQWATYSENHIHSFEILGRIPSGCSAIPPPNKPVSQYTKENVLVRSFESIKQATEVTGINQANISQTVNGKRKSAGGFIWTAL